MTPTDHTHPHTSTPGRGDTRIIGIVLVRNEDAFIRQVITNIVDFCDRIYVADNESSDQTYEIARQLCAQFKKIDLRRVSHPRESHTLIEKYAGTRTWVFGVDGDEIYDPNGLVRMRNELLSGRFDPWWTVLPNMLNCVNYDLESMRAKGYLAPPSRTGSKLYNFGIISEWSHCQQERLHSGNLVFKPGYDKSLRCPLHEQLSWEDSYFRFLHMCFVQRSSLDRSAKRGVRIRRNPAEVVPFRGLHGLMRYLSYKVRGIETDPGWKTQWYMKGGLVTKDTSPFFCRTRH